jgi:hypothetical protein
MGVEVYSHLPLTMAPDYEPALERILVPIEEDRWVGTRSGIEVMENRRSVALAGIIIYNRINEMKHVSPILWFLISVRL